MKAKQPILLAGLALTVLAVVSCSSTPLCDARHGDAVASVVQKQTLDPAAANRLTPVVGVGPGVAMAIVARFNRSFASPPPPANVFAIGVGAGSNTSISSP